MLKILHIPKSLFCTSNYKVLLFFYKLWVSVRCLFCYNLEINGIIPCEHQLLLMPLFNRDLFLKKGYKDEKETKKRTNKTGKVKTAAIRRSQIFFRSCLAQQKLKSQRISFCQPFVVLHCVLQLSLKDKNVQQNKQTHIKTRILCPLKKLLYKSNNLLSKELWGMKHKN